MLGALVGGAVGAQATGLVDGGHYIRAAERAARVAKGLALCIQEYASLPRPSRRVVADCVRQLSYDSKAVRRRNTGRGAAVEMS